MRYSDEYLVTPERAAANAVARLHVGIASGLPGLTGWRAPTLDPPITVHDLDGHPLFYDFPVRNANGSQVGVARAAAATALAQPVMSVYLGRMRWDVAGATERATAAIVSEHRGRVLRANLVCYAYPKLGIAIEWRTPRGATRRTVFDVGDLSVVPDVVEPELRGPGARSIFDGIPEEAVGGGIERYRLHENLVTEIEERSRQKLAMKLELAEFTAVQVAVGPLLKLWTNRRLTFCTHTYSHECFVMHGQQTGVWCTVATGQMVLDFWRYHFTQAQIAAAMGTGSGGTSWGGEEAGLESLTGNHFDASSDYSPTFAKAKAEIDANRPFDYSYSYHSMACAGYSEQTIAIQGSTPSQQVYLYDPWPVSTGTIRWETWGAGQATVAGFVYLRRL